MLTDIRVHPGAPVYIDVALLSSIHGMNDEVVRRLKELNETEGEVCCWGEGTDASGIAGAPIKDIVHGLVRLGYYEKDPDTGAVRHVMALYEGQAHNGQMDGFGRLMLDLQEGLAHHRENVIGYFAGDEFRMNGKTLYWSNGELVYSGEQYGHFRDEATLEVYDFNSFVDAGQQEEEEQHEQWQAEQRRRAEE